MTAPRLRAPTLVAIVLALVAVAVGALERSYLASHTIGALTSDGAVIGLMASHLLHHGQWPAYMWGQAYGGSLEMALTALAFLVGGTSTASLLATTAATTAVAVFAMWRAARRLVGEPAAAVAALGAWVGSSLLAWRSIKPGGSYLVGLALAWFAILFLIRLRQGERTDRVLVAAGLLLGLSVWTSPMTLQLLVPALLWSLAALRSLGRRVLLVLGGGVVGGAPVLAYGAVHHFSNLAPPGGGHAWDGFATRLGQFFTQEVPIAASLRVEGSLHWVLGPLGPALSICLGVGFVAVLVHVLRDRTGRCALPVLTLCLLPFLYAANTLASHVGQGRYVELGTTMGFVLLGVAVDNLARLATRRFATRSAASLARVAVAAIAVALLASLGATAIRDEPGPLLAEFPVGGAPMPANDTALLTLLAEHHVHDAFAGYWIAYRVTFETGERTLATPFSLGRYPPIRAAVRASPHPAYLFVRASPTWRRFVAWCAANSIRAGVFTKGDFVVVAPAVRVLPSELARGVLAPGPVRSAAPPRAASGLGGRSAPVAPAG